MPEARLIVEGCEKDLKPLKLMLVILKSALPSL